MKKDAKAVTVEYAYDNLNRVTVADYPGDRLMTLPTPTICAPMERVA